MGVVACAFFVTGLGKLSITTDHRVLFSEDSTHSRYISEYAETFSKSPNTLVALHCKTREECADLLPTLIDITDNLRRIPGVISVTGLSNLLYFRSSDGDLVVSNYLEGSCKPNCDVYSPGNNVDPVGYLVNPEWNAYVLHLDVETTKLSSAQLSYLYRSIRDSIVSLWPIGRDISLVGTFPLSFAFFDVIQSELGSHMAASMCLLVVLIFVFIRDVRLTVIAISVSLATIVSTMGTAGHFGLVLSTATASLPTIIFTLTLASSMHYFMQVVRLISEDPSRDIEEVAVGARESQKTPIILTAVTTSMAMLSLLTVDSPPIASIGIWTATSFFFMVIILLYLAPKAVAALPKIRKSPWLEMIQPLANQQARRRPNPTVITLGLALVTILFATVLNDLQVGDDFVEMFPSQSEYRTNVERLKEFNIAQNTIQISIDSGSPEGIFDPSFISKVSSFQSFAGKQPYVLKTLSIIDHLAVASPHLMNKALIGLNEEELSQLLFSLQLFDTSQGAYASLVDPDFRYVSVQLLLAESPTVEMKKIESKLLDWASSEMNSQIRVSGESLQLAHLSTDSLPSMLVSITVSLGIGALLLGVFFRSTAIAILLLTTTAIPVLVGLGIWALFHTEIGLALTLIVAVCIGVVIDDAIHVIYRFVDGRDRLHLDRFDASSFAVHRVGGALISTTVILAVGFGSLAISDFSINSTFGASTALILVIALAIDLLILPTLLSIFYQTRTHAKNELPS